MKKSLLVFFLLVLFTSVSFLPENPTIGFRTTSLNINSSPRHSYDVLNYKLNLDIYNCFKPPYPKTFSGSEQITLKIDSSLYSIPLDAVNSSLSIDSVKFTNGNLLNFTHSNNRLTIALNRMYIPGEILNLNIYYKHKDISDSAFFVSHGLVFTDCECEGARRWFPCWDKPSDKATTDLTAKVPSDVLLGSNGRLADSIKSADTIYYRWISRDPMATYLVAIAGSSSYKLSLRYWRKLSNPNDSIPVRLYYKGWEDPALIRDTINKITDCFSQKFCEYPLEKIGFASSDSSVFVCMENQTLITLFPGTWSVVAATHEFGHHWFGDIITCGTWADIWLNEGFATYCEAIYDEYSSGIAAYKHDLSVDSMYYFTGNNNKPIYNPYFINYTPPKGLLFYELFNNAITYAKGACVLHMLRNVLGDSTFFAVIRGYLSDTNYRFKSVTTDDFTAKLNQVTGQDYTWFIDQWVKQPNHPKYKCDNEIINMGNGMWRLNHKISQNLLYSGFHKMPIELKILFTDGADTTVKIVNDTNNQQFSFIFPKEPLHIIFDPDNKIILKEYITTNAFTSNCSSNQKPVSPMHIIMDTIHIEQQGRIRDIKVSLNINDSDDGDLYVKLYSPTNIEVVLSQYNGKGGQNYTNTIFDDSASLSIGEGTPPFSGKFRPQSPLSGLYDNNITGNWKIFVFNKSSQNTGMLLNWCLNIGYQGTVGINDTAAIIPNRFTLFQNYPNPFNPHTTIKFLIPENRFVSIKIYDLLGREIQTLLNEKKIAGTYEVSFDGGRLPSGVYFYKFTAGDYTEIKKMVLIK